MRWQYRPARLTGGFTRRYWQRDRELRAAVGIIRSPCLFRGDSSAAILNFDQHVRCINRIRAHDQAPRAVESGSAHGAERIEHQVQDDLLKLDAAYHICTSGITSRFRCLAVATSCRRTACRGCRAEAGEGPVGLRADEIVGGDRSGSLIRRQDAGRGRLR
jgi:hypothetical protein